MFVVSVQNLQVNETLQPIALLGIDYCVIAGASEIDNKAVSDVLVGGNLTVKREAIQDGGKKTTNKGKKTGTNGKKSKKERRKSGRSQMEKNKEGQLKVADQQGKT